MSDSTAGMFAAQVFRESMDGSGLTRQDAADRLGVGVNMVSAMRTGRKAPSTEVLARIAAVFNRPVADFLNLPPAGEWTLRHYRLAAGLTQPDVAEQVGVDATSVSKWELYRTRPPESTVDRLAAVYKVDPGELRQVVDRAHGGPMDQILTLTESVRAVAHIAVQAVLRDPESTRGQHALTDIRDQVIQALSILNGAMTQLDSPAALTRAKKTVAELAQVLSETAEGSGATRPGDS